MIFLGVSLLEWSHKPINKKVTIYTSEVHPERTQNRNNRRVIAFFQSGNFPRKLLRNVQSFCTCKQELRERVYSILLDAKTKKPEDCVVNEWFASEENPEVEKPRPVAVKPLDASLDVPSLETLWFGTEAEDGPRRLRAFLTCMKVRWLLLLWFLLANGDHCSFDNVLKIPFSYLSSYKISLSNSGQ